jgi:hypothetical protein
MLLLFCFQIVMVTIRIYFFMALIKTNGIVSFIPPGIFAWSLSRISIVSNICPNLFSDGFYGPAQIDKVMSDSFRSYSQEALH